MERFQQKYCCNLPNQHFENCRILCQTLVFSLVQLKGIHCPKPHCCNRVVDMFRHSLLYFSLVGIFLQEIFNPIVLFITFFDAEMLIHFFWWNPYILRRLGWKCAMTKGLPRKYLENGAKKYGVIVTSQDTACWKELRAVKYCSEIRNQDQNIQVLKVLKLNSCIIYG